MSLILNESDLETIIVDNYWKIFHEDEDPPLYIHIERQVSLKPYGTADIIAFYTDEEWDLRPDSKMNYPEATEKDFCFWNHVYIHVIELKINILTERDLSQLCRYKTAIERAIIGKWKYHRCGRYQEVDYIGLGSPPMRPADVECRYSLVGQKPKDVDYPIGSNGDFVYLYQAMSTDYFELDIWLFVFGLTGFKFNRITQHGWGSEDNEGPELTENIQKQLTKARLMDSAINQGGEDERIHEAL